MTDLLGRGQAWLAKKLTKHAARQIIYRRGEQQLFVLAALGVTYVSEFAGDGISVKTEVRDYLIDTDTLRIDGERIEPARGDRIIEISEELAYHYEVLPIGDKRVWQYSDLYREKFRIHTRSVRFVEPVRPEFSIRELPVGSYLTAGQTLDFGNVAVEQTKLMQVFNAGTAELELHEIETPDGISIENGYGSQVTVGIGQTQRFDLRLTADEIEPGPFEDQIIIHTNLEEPYTLKLIARIGAAIGDAKIGSTFIVA